MTITSKLINHSCFIRNYNFTVDRRTITEDTATHFVEYHRKLGCTDLKCYADKEDVQIKYGWTTEIKENKSENELFIVLAQNSLSLQAKQQEYISKLFSDLKAYTMEREKSHRNFFDQLFSTVKEESSSKHSSLKFKTLLTMSEPSICTVKEVLEKLESYRIKKALLG